jgi:glucan phosphorylase
MAHLAVIGSRKVNGVAEVYFPEYRRFHVSEP